jgi:phosphoenolpyruvate carboxylase
LELPFRRIRPLNVGKNGYQRMMRVKYSQPRVATFEECA